LSPLRQTVQNPEFEHTTTIDSSNETSEQAFERLHIGIKTQSLSNKEVLDNVFKVLVGGPFDLESRFIIENGESIVGMLNLLDECSSKLQVIRHINFFYLPISIFICCRLKYGVFLLALFEKVSEIWKRVLELA
jgi:hypothetical protein